MVLRIVTALRTSQRTVNFFSRRLQDSLHMLPADSKRLFSCSVFWRFFSVLYTFMYKVIVFALRFWCSYLLYCWDSIHDALQFRFSSFFSTGIDIWSRCQFFYVLIHCLKGRENIYAKVRKSVSQRSSHLHDLLMKEKNCFPRANLPLQFLYHSSNCFQTILFTRFSSSLLDLV